MAREAQKKKVEPALTLHRREPLMPVGGPQVGAHESVADVLRRTREQYGEDLRGVAEALRIRYVHLLAIEEGRFRDLPGSTYALGFVRSYAEFLGLDGLEMVERFKEEVAELNRKTQLVFPTPVPEGKVPGGALILISVVLLAVAYGAWTYLSRPGATIADLIPPVPEHLQSLSGDSAGPADGVPAEMAQPAPMDSQLAVTPPSDSAFDRPAVPAMPAETAAPEAAVTETPGGEPTDSEPAGEPMSGAASAPEAMADPAGDQPAPPADETQGEEMGQDAGAAAPEPVVAARDASPAHANAAPAAVQAAPLPMATEPNPALTASPSLGSGTREQAMAPANDPASEDNLAPADHLDSAVEESIPAAPLLESRVPGREPQVYGADNADARIVLHARHDSWVQVRDAQDSLLLTRVLRQGDEYWVPNRSGLTLLTGNAGGIEILVDGRRLAPLGPVGAVRRDILLDPEQLAQRGPAE